VPGAKFISSSNKLKKPTLLDLSETQTAGQWNKENNAGIVPRAYPYWWQDLFDPFFRSNTSRSVDSMDVHRLACPKPELEVEHICRTGGIVACRVIVSGVLLQYCNYADLRRSYHEVCGKFCVDKALPYTKIL
jgi:hypothetical protein